MDLNLSASSRQNIPDFLSLIRLVINFSPLPRLRIPVIKSVSESETMQKFWNKYRQDFSYAADITFETVCDAIIKIMDKIKF